MEHLNEGDSVPLGNHTNAHTTCHLKNDEIEFLLELVERAGRVALAMRESVDIQEKTGPHDKVTSADLELSRILVEEMSQRFPKDTIVSEEDAERGEVPTTGRVWMIDPIDGTESYIRNDGQYSVMVGLLADGIPVFGFVNVPVEKLTYFGGPDYGCWKLMEDGTKYRFDAVPELNIDGLVKVIMGFRDRKRHPWIEELEQVQLIKTGSIGVKVARILERRADLFVHMSGKLKMWDTAGPVAIALAGSLEVGTMQTDDLKFELPNLIHETSVIIGRKGAINWCRKFLEGSI